jgi:creatinine amidohydrolase
MIVKWNELKWQVISQLDRQIPVLIPLGSVEQHGRHLPLFTDTAQVQAIADRLDAKLEQRVLTLPTLWLGSSDHHLDFPGTLSVRPSLYTEILRQLATSILGAGFQRLFFLNGHGGNETPAAQALAELVSSQGPAQHALLALASWWAVGKPDALQLDMASPSISHACEYETSLMLYLHSNLVDLDAASDVEPVFDSAWITGEKRVSLFRRFSSMTKTGNLGKAKAASKRKGEAILQGVVDDVERFLIEFSDWPLPSTIGPSETHQ